MPESQEIHQIEYRWQPARDMSPVATSMSPNSARLWVQRIGPWVRHPGVDAPTDSVRYEVFGDRAAALVWRQRDRQAVGFESGRDGRPLVSRVLLGPAELLTPEVAVAVCYAGLPATIGPRPGAVTADTALPPMAAARLTGLMRDHAEELDRAAAQEAGLERVVAAALGDRDTPLSVQLPDHVITRSPRGGSQAALLWGLRRTAWPILGRGGRRGWSFSTFELPLSDMDPDTLPDIVFRLAQAAPQAPPMTLREEIRVRPHDPPAPVETMYQHLARLLVVAYRDRGGDELGRMIAGCTGDLPSADRRIQAVYKALDPGPPAATAVSDGQRHQQLPASQPQEPPGGLAPTAGPAPTEPPATVRLARPAAGSAVSPGRSAQDARRLRAMDSQRGRPEAASAGTLSGLLARLAAGPADPEFEPAFQALRVRNFKSDTNDRAAARKLICDHSWYVGAFEQYDKKEFEGVLVAVFWHTVMPDLTESRTADELAYWADELAAPAVVIKALYMTTETTPGARRLMDQALGPALARRWLNEQGIRLPPAVQAPAATLPRAAASGTPYSASGPREAAVLQAVKQVASDPQPLQSLLAREVTVPLSVVLAVCVVVIVLLLIIVF